ncbi:MAG: hypothetical protein F4076_02170 [Acidimicrobiaceae bacterium]|nr:hypothetical protein [Acidimicrobiaceae bacterium]
MADTSSPAQPPSREPAPRWCLAVSALGIAAVLLGAMIAQQRAEAAHAHPLPPPGHSHAPTTSRPLICSPPNACYPPPTTRRPVTTTTRRPVTTTTRRPATTTTRRPIIVFPRCFPNCPTTTTRPPTTTKPATTTTQASGSDPDCRSWACREIDAGIDNGYLPDDYNPDEDTGAEDLLAIIERYGEHNPDFDAEAALETLPEEGSADRGDMFIAIAVGIGIDVDPEADPFEVADELADLGILKGHDRDGDGVVNPYSRPDADPDSTMTNAQLAAFLDRIEPDDDAGDRGPGGSGGRPPGGADDDEDPCTTGLGLTAGERSRFVSQLRWATLVDIESQGEPGRPWPPHPDVPGGAEYLVVSESPVWPVIDPDALWHVPSDDGCLWQAASVQTRLEQLLPWTARHRSMIENTRAARPGAGLGTYLSRWDNLSAAEQAQARQSHRSRDIRASCDVATAMVAADAYDQCRWQLPSSGVWSWQARACFEGVAGDAVSQECATLAGGVEWFLEMIDYTSGTTLQHNSGPGPPAEPRRGAPRS